MQGGVGGGGLAIPIAGGYPPNCATQGFNYWIPYGTLLRFSVKTISVTPGRCLQKRNFGHECPRFHVEHCDRRISGTRQTLQDVQFVWSTHLGVPHGDLSSFGIISIFCQKVDHFLEMIHSSKIGTIQKYPFTLE